MFFLVTGQFLRGPKSLSRHICKFVDNWPSRKGGRRVAGPFSVLISVTIYHPHPQPGLPQPHPDQPSATSPSPTPPSLGLQPLSSSTPKHPATSLQFCYKQSHHRYHPFVIVSASCSAIFTARPSDHQKSFISLQLAPQVHRSQLQSYPPCFDSNHLAFLKFTGGQVPGTSFVLQCCQLFKKMVSNLCSRFWASGLLGNRQVLGSSLWAPIGLTFHSYCFRAWFVFSKGMRKMPVRGWTTPR